MAFCLFYIQGQGEACKDKIDAGKTQRSASLRGIWLHAKLDNFGFSKIKFSDSAQCSPPQSYRFREYLLENNFSQKFIGNKLIELFSILVMFKTTVWL